MAHPMLASVARQSLLAATTAALMAGPLAVAGISQSLAPVIDGTSTEVIELTCKEAQATEDEDLIAEFCTKDGEDKVSDPVTDAEKAVAEGSGTVTKTVEDVVRSAPTGTETPTGGGGGGGGGGGKDPLEPLDNDTEVGGAGGNYTPVPENNTSTNSGGFDGQEALARDRGAPAGSNYDVNGPYRPGMRSYSELTLQPFAPPVVTAPLFDLAPQIAEQLFGTATTTGESQGPLASATAASATSTAATPDAAGWLAATATGLLMLVGAGHAIAGGRTPRRRRA